MKKSTSIQLLGILFIALLSACSTPSYFGKTYPATQNVDVYLDAEDVKKPYTTMGTLEYDRTLSRLPPCSLR